jgi:hypothetical protein
MADSHYALLVLSQLSSVQVCPGLIRFGAFWVRTPLNDLAQPSLLRAAFYASHESIVCFDSARSSIFLRTRKTWRVPEGRI